MKAIDILVRVVRAMPYSAQITDIDIFTEENALRFTWRSSRFRVQESTLRPERFHVDECTTRGMLAGSDLSILVQCLLNTPKEDATE